MAWIMDEELLLEMEREISEFEEWQNRLNEDLSYLIFEPATEENLQKLAEVIDYHFSDIMFQHEDHEIKVERLTDGGIGITVMLDYEDHPEDYYVDFEIEPGVNFEIRLSADNLFARDDEFEPVIDDVECEVYCWADIEAELDKFNEAMMEARAEHLLAMSDATASEGTATPDTQEKKNESPDDILFAPIQLEEKKPEPPSDPYLDCCG